MESGTCPNSTEQLPALFKTVSSEVFFGFDTIPSPGSQPTIVDAPEAVNINNHATDISMPSPTLPIQTTEHSRHHSISISMPSSPSALNIEQSRRVQLHDIPVINSITGQPDHPTLSNDFSSQPPKKTKFYSQPIQATVSQNNSVPLGKVPDTEEGVSRTNRLKDKRFDSFKTWSGKLERQISTLRGRPQDRENVDVSEITQSEALPAVHRYFDALEGPELETLKSSEELVLPEDKKWPFLLRFPISSFGMCLGVSSQTILWKTLATSPSMSFLHVSLTVNLVLWCVSIALIGIVAFIYALKIIFYFEAVRREYYHPVRVNFFFAPWIACMFLTIGAPRAFLQHHLKAIHPALCCVFIVPIFFLELKIYGQWLSGGKRRLSKVANPSSHLSVVGNFVGAILAANFGWVEVGKFLWAIGLAHYLVVFVTLYQRLPTSEALPKELHPVYSMFIATPSAASVAWKAIYGEFDAVSRTFYFIALFLYISLIVRINFFRGFRFSVAWWAYTFPMTTVAVATIRYAEAVPCFFSKGLAVSLSLMSSTMVSVLLVSTLLHAFVWRTLFPNDLAIAITKKKNRHGAPRPQAKEKTAKAAIDIKRWAKESSRSLVTSITKSNSTEKDSDRSQRGHV